MLTNYPLRPEPAGSLFPVGVHSKLYVRRAIKSDRKAIVNGGISALSEFGWEKW
jgi:hypothetical protein